MDKQRRNFLAGAGLIGASGLFGIDFFKKIFGENTEAKEVNANLIARKNIPLLATASLGINLGGNTYYNTERMFIDLMKMSSPMNVEENIKKGMRFDLNGYPTFIPLGQECNAIVFVQPTNVTDSKGNILNKNEYVKNGEYVLLYDGAEAKIGLAETADSGKNVFRVFNNAKITSHKKGRAIVKIEIDSPWYQMNLGISSVDPKNPIKNIRLVPANKEATYANQIWTDEFLALWSELKAFRFMDMMNTNNSNLSRWENRSKVENATWGTDNGVPYEILIDLCNRLNIAGWFCIPHQADDHFITQFATLLKNNLKTTALIEYSNEVWNWGFQQAQYSLSKFREHGLKSADVGGHAEYYAHRSMQIFKLFDNVYGLSRADRVVRVFAGQAAFDGLNKVILGYENAYQYADAFATAPYMQLGMGPKEVSERQRWSKEDFIAYFNNTALPESVSWMKQNKALADKYGLPLIAYEGGQHMSLGGGAENNEAMVKMMIAVNEDSRMEALYKKYLDAWLSAGGKLFCHFNSNQTWSKWGCWGVFQSPFQPLEASAKYQGIAKWANARGQKMRLK